METRTVLKGSDDERLTEELYNASFPRGKREPFACIRDVSAAGKADLKALYADGTFVGMYCVYVHEGAAYLLYLAVEEGLRGKGYGATALEIIKNAYDMPIVLRQEAPAVDTRLLGSPYRRIRYFVNNGFVDSDHKIIYMGTPYEILCRGECPDNKAVQDAFKSFQRACMRVSRS